MFNTFSLSVLPLFQAYWLIHIVYIILIIVIVLGFMQWQKKQLQKLREGWKTKENELSQKALEDSKTELESINSEFENAKSELETKIRNLEKQNKSIQKDLRKKAIELAKKAKKNKTHNHLLEQVKEKISEIENPSTVNKRTIKEVRRLLDNYMGIEDDTFEIQIDEIHQEFFKMLKEKHPDLTTYDLRLSAYLKMGLNTREIAEIVHVLPSSINVSRSRLRKKLHLDADQDLYEFMNAFEEVEHNS